MHLPLNASALALIALLPGAVAAQELTASAGVTLTSRYVSSGLEQSDGAAIQPWAELGYGGLYIGAWASNTSKDLIGHSSEIDLYFGYRGEVGMLAYDLGYARYYYRSPKLNCCGEFKLDLSIAPTEQFTIGTNFAYDDEAKILNSKIYGSFAATEKLSIDVAYGEFNKGGRDYWSAGASYQINDSFGLSLAYHDTNVSKGLAVLSLDYSFGG